MTEKSFIPASDLSAADGQTQRQLPIEGDRLACLSDKERRAYVAIRVNDVDIGDHADAIGVEPDVVGILVRRAEEKLGER